MLCCLPCRVVDSAVLFNCPAGLLIMLCCLPCRVVDSAVLFNCPAGLLIVQFFFVLQSC